MVVGVNMERAVTMVPPFRLTVVTAAVVVSDLASGANHSAEEKID
jgi:hypothetical protein